MREIKFRVWDTVDGVMWEWPAVVQFGFKILADLAYIVMQYIGIKDKNGKEIYEEDIVKTAGLWFGKVVYSCGHFFLAGPNNLSYSMDHEWSDSEVIGNTCENPELMQGGQGA